MQVPCHASALISFAFTGFALGGLQKRFTTFIFGTANSKVTTIFYSILHYSGVSSSTFPRGESTNVSAISLFCPPTPDFGFGKDGEVVFIPDNSGPETRDSKITEQLSEKIH